MMTEQERKALDTAFHALHVAICAPRTHASGRAQEVLDRAESEIRQIFEVAPRDEDRATLDEPAPPITTEVPRWRVSDVVRAICAARNVPWRNDPSATAILRACEWRPAPFTWLARHEIPYSLAQFFLGDGFFPVHTDEGLAHLANRIVSEAQRLNVPRRG